MATLRYDFHMHTHHSMDSWMRPAGIIRQARRRGLAGIAVTDHDTVAGGLAVRACAPAGFLVIVGAEYHTDVGDIVCLFLSEEITTRDALGVIAQTHRQGGVAFLPHPLRGHPHVPAEVLEAVDGYEALNSRAGAFDPSTAPGPTDWAPLLGTAVLGCSDAHLYGEIGQAFTTMEGPATEAGVRDNLLAGTVRPGGARGPSRNFYLSQLIKMIRTRDARMALRAVRRLARRLT